MTTRSARSIHTALLGLAILGMGLPASSAFAQPPDRRVERRSDRDHGRARYRDARRAADRHRDHGPVWRATNGRVHRAHGHDHRRLYRHCDRRTHHRHVKHHRARHARRDVGVVILGTAAGGILGAELGHEYGDPYAGAVVGAVLGGVIADDL